MPQRGRVLEQAVLHTSQLIDMLIGRRLGDRRRQLAEQTLELRGLRGKSAARLQLMARRLEGEAAEFEQCAPRLAGLLDRANGYENVIKLDSIGRVECAATTAPADPTVPADPAVPPVPVPDPNAPPPLPA